MRLSCRWSPPLELIVSPVPHTELNVVRFLLFQKQIARLYPVFSTTIKPKAQFNIWIWKDKIAAPLIGWEFEMREQGMTSSTLCIVVCSLSAAASQWTKVVPLPYAAARNWPHPWISECAVCCFFLPLLKSLEWKDIELGPCCHCRHSSHIHSRESDKLPTNLSVYFHSIGGHHGPDDLTILGPVARKWTLISTICFLLFFHYNYFACAGQRSIASFKCRLWDYFMWEFTQQQYVCMDL